MISSLHPVSRQTLAKLASIFSGLVFGIYWIPLRVLDESGFDGIWSVALFSLVSLLLVSPFAISRWRQLLPGRVRFHATSVVCGLAFVLYAGAFVYTEVIRVIVLFYLMPIWGFLLARVVTGEKITAIRWVSMVLAGFGLMVIFGTENGIPLPSNTGDWMALLGGFIWAGVSLSLLTDRHDPINYTIGFLFWSTVLAIVLGIIGTQGGVLLKPDWNLIDETLYWLVPFSILIVIPAAFATMYGPSLLNPGVVGLFFMIEISVGTTTAALFAGEPFGPREVIGVILITLAGIAETIYQWVSKPRSSATN